MIRLSNIASQLKKIVAASQNHKCFCEFLISGGENTHPLSNVLHNNNKANMEYTGYKSWIINLKFGLNN